jgi:hypothetical protein
MDPHFRIKIVGKKSAIPSDYVMDTDFRQHFPGKRVCHILQKIQYIKAP